MSYVIDRFRRQQQYIDFGGIENTPPLLSGEGEVVVPSGERVTVESPIQANNKVENENKCGSEMKAWLKAVKPKSEVSLRLI